MGQARTDFVRLSQKEGWIGKVFQIIADRAGRGYVGDAKPKPVSHRASDLVEIKEILWQQVGMRYIEDSIDWQTPDEALRDMIAPMQFRQLMLGPMVKDSFDNPITGIGVWGQDPGRMNFARPPVMMAPMEASAFYSNGGIPQIIIDKKAKGVLLNGYSFEGEGWSVDETKILHDYSEKLGTSEALVNTLRDALMHGGAFLYPAFRKDTPLSTPMSIDDLLRSGILAQNCIDHWAEADRWNTVLVPNWDITARDYLYPRTLYVPIGGVEVATARAAVVRPRMLDYWGMIRQIGWTTSDFEGWIRPLLGYEIIIAAIPIMAQQMSLLVHTIPLDGIIAQDGVKAAQKFIAENVQAMRSWSMVNPQTVNSFGELKAIERHYEGFNDLIGISRQHVSASCGIPESVLFPAAPTGLADSRGEDVLLKQSETIKLVQESIKPQLNPIARILAISCFGPAYVDAKGVGIMQKLQNIHFSFETPVVRTAEQQADAGQKFAAMIQSLTTAEVPLDMAYETAKLFFPDVEIPKTLTDRIKQVAEGDVDAQAYEQGMDEVQRRWGPDIVQRLSERWAAKIADRGKE